MTGWIKLHRSILEWEWYDDVNTRILLLHLLVSVNYEPKPWKGIMIQPGSMVLSWDSLSKSCKLSVQQCRTAMKKLILSGEVTKKATSKYQVITLVKWDKLQEKKTKGNKESNKQITSNQQTNNKQSTTTKEDKNKRSIRNKEINNKFLSEIKISDLEKNEIEFFEIAKAFQELFIKNLKENQAPTKHQENAKFKSYVDPIRLMMTSDGVTKSQLTKVFQFLDSPEGNFWKPNILSTTKLREKISQILLKINSNESATEQPTINRQTADTYRQNGTGWG